MPTLKPRPATKREQSTHLAICWAFSPGRPGAWVAPRHPTTSRHAACAGRLVPPPTVPTSIDGMFTDTWVTVKKAKQRQREREPASRRKTTRNRRKKSGRLRFQPKYVLHLHAVGGLVVNQLVTAAMRTLKTQHEHQKHQNNNLITTKTDNDDVPCQHQKHHPHQP